MEKNNKNKKPVAEETKASTVKDSTIAVIDVQALVNQTPSVADLRNEQQAKVSGLQQWINSANAEINQLADQNEKVALFQKYRLELDSRQKNIREEYGQKVQAIDAELSKIIGDYAKKEGYTHVFAKGIVVFGGKDITEEVAKLVKK